MILLKTPPKKNSKNFDLNNYDKSDKNMSNSDIGTIKVSKENIFAHSNMNNTEESKFIQKEKKSEAEFVKKEEENQKTPSDYTLLLLCILAIPYIHFLFYLQHHSDLSYILSLITMVLYIIVMKFTRNYPTFFSVRGMISLIYTSILVIILFYSTLFVMHHPQYLLHFCILNVFLMFLNILQILNILVGIDIQKQLGKIEEVKQDMKNLVNPNRMYERLGVDLMSLLVGTNLIPIADPEQEGQLLAKVAALRQRLTDDLGYIIPNIRIMDSTEITEYEYNICVRNNVVARGEVYPDRVLVTSEEWEKTKLPVPNDAVITNDPVFETKCYWVFENDIPKNNDITFVEATDVIIEHLKKCVLKNVDKIITKKDMLKLMELVRAENPTLVEDLIPTLIGVTDLRKIYVNLIREGVCVKDVLFIFERLNDYARFSKEPDVLSERLRIALNHLTF